jgi:hypothetical protein
VSSKCDFIGHSFAFGLNSRVMSSLGWTVSLTLPV